MGEKPPLPVFIFNFSYYIIILFQCFDERVLIGSSYEAAVTPPLSATVRIYKCNSRAKSGLWRRVANSLPGNNLFLLCTMPANKKLEMRQYDSILLDKHRFWPVELLYAGNVIRNIAFFR